ncbi:hypothetical protein C9Z12_25735, partial (plasmid) [Escherichia coli]
LPSETMIWQPEFTDKTLSRKPGAVHFNSDLQLCFRLQPEGPHCWYHRYCRRSLRADFRTLILLLKSLSE